MAKRLDAFTQSYIRTALWSSTGDDGEPLDKNHDIRDIAAGTLLRMARDCKAFQKKHAVALRASGLSATRAGHDYWLNCNGHGAGFWDEDAADARAEKALKVLDKASENKTFDLYIGDDGKIYGSG